MSGGSFNHLCYKYADDLVQGTYDEDLERMADDLAGRGFADAAKETYDLLLTMRQIRVRIEARIERLKNVWHAVEWHRSCDSGPEVVDAAIAKYRGEA